MSVFEDIIDVWKIVSSREMEELSFGGIENNHVISAKIEIRGISEVSCSKATFLAPFKLKRVMKGGVISIGVDRR